MALQTFDPLSAAARVARETTPMYRIDQDKLSQALAALSQAEGTGEAARKKAIPLFAHELEQGRAAARAGLEDNGRGLICANSLSRLQDDLIAAIFNYVVTHIYPADNPTTAEKLTIVAVGGYGRDTLAPGSDVDLLFLLPYKQTAWGESVVEAMLYLLWDLRQKVGHSVRTVDECLRQARADITVRTALLDARYLLGEASLLETLRTRFDKEIIRGTAPEFVAAKLAERDRRLSKPGASRYVVEPNVKEGKGGLRDLNTLFWIAHYVYRVRDPQELVAAGLFTRQEMALFQRCDEFLWRVRCHLHFLAGRAEERLSFDRQRPIAEKLGYVSHSGLSAVERFMKHYFLIAKDVGDLTAIVCAALEAREAKSGAALDRFFGRLRSRKKALKSSDFAIETDRVTLARPDAFQRDPINLIRIFRVSQSQNMAIHPDAMRQIMRSLRLVDHTMRANAEANRLFLEILCAPHSQEIVLRRMNESGVLGRFIPDFGRIVAMMQFNMYHHYTVDEHLLRTVGQLAEIEQGRLSEEAKLATELSPTISSRKCLYVAVFLHDIAKGRPEDHSIAGAEVARRLCPRFGLSESETETVAWLIEHHLAMSNTAQTRDLSDRRTIENFAKLTQTHDRLKMLLVLTVCDTRAVGPGVWNGWKATLLRTLYWETEVILTGGHSAMDRGARVAQSQEELRKALPAWSDPEFTAYAQRHYPAYWLKVDLTRKIQHAQLLRLTEVEMRSLTTEITMDADRGVTELTVVAPDHPYLLSTIAGACAAAGANIVDAQVFTTSDGLALDTIAISREFDHDSDEMRRAKRMAYTVEKALRGEIRLADLIAQRTHPHHVRASAFTIAPEAVVDNALSNRYTVLEISCLDRPGLLYDLTSTISKLNLNIGSAHIVTFGEKAVDAFYVTDLTGFKISEPHREAMIKKKILAALKSPENASEP